MLNEPSGVGVIGSGKKNKKRLGYVLTKFAPEYTDFHWLPEDHFRANGVTNINDQVFPPVFSSGAKCRRPHPGNLVQRNGCRLNKNKAPAFCRGSHLC
jgi:hypothetical protein